MSDTYQTAAYLQSDKTSVPSSAAPYRQRQAIQKRKLQGNSGLTSHHSQSMHEMIPLQMAQQLDGQPYSKRKSVHEGQPVTGAGQIAESSKAPVNIDPRRVKHLEQNIEIRKKQVGHSGAVGTVCEDYRNVVKDVRKKKLPNPRMSQESFEVDGTEPLLENQGLSRSNLKVQSSE